MKVVKAHDTYNKKKDQTIDIIHSCRDHICYIPITLFMDDKKFVYGCPTAFCVSRSDFTEPRTLGKLSECDAVTTFCAIFQKHGVFGSDEHAWGRYYGVDGRVFVCKASMVR